MSPETSPAAQPPAPGAPDQPLEHSPTTASTLPRRRLFAYAVVLCVLAAAAATVLLRDRLSALCWQSFRGREIRSSLGFELRRVPVRLGGASQEHYAFTQLVPDGPMAQAGFRPGDTLVHWLDHGDTPEYLYQVLEASRGQDIYLDVVTVQAGEVVAKSERRVKLHVPR